MPRGRKDWSPGRPAVKEAPEKIRLWAATSESKAPVILQRGLFKPFPAYNSEEVVQFFAEQKGNDRGERGVILEIMIDPRDLAADWDAFEDPPYQAWVERRVQDDDEWLQAIKDRRIPTPINLDDWETSLDVVHSAIHSGNVPPEDIRIGWRVG